MRKDIAIIEAGNHRECIESLCLLFHDVRKKLGQVHWYVPQRMCDYFQPQYPEFTFIPLQADTLTQALADQRYGVIFAETIQDHYDVFAQAKLTAPLVVRFHNVHTWLRPYMLNLGDPLLLVKTWLKDCVIDRETFLRKKIVSKIQIFNFCDAMMERYYYKYCNKQKQVMSNVPAHYYDHHYALQGSQSVAHKVTFTITGKLDKYRKDYTVVCRALELLSLAQRQQLRVVLLGKLDTSAYAHYIVQRLRNITGLEIVVFQDRVPEAIFNTYMQETDYLLAPMQVKTHFSSFFERYGASKVSGSINDSVHYGIPIILPQAYATPEYIAGFVSQYTSARVLARILVQCLSTDRQKAKREYQTYLLKYNDKIRMSLVSALQHIGVI